MEKRTLWCVNGGLLVLLMALDVAYMVQGSLALKAATSAVFVVIGLFNLAGCIRAKVPLRFPLWMMAALAACMLGDVLLGIQFYVGVVFFAVGHVFYFVAYCMLERFNRRDLLYGLGLFVVALCILLFVPALDFGGGLMQGVCCAYALIISFMVGKAVSHLAGSPGVLSGVIAAGGILFFVSDLMLVLDQFGSLPYTEYFCLGTYYPAQFLLAISLSVYAAGCLAAKRERNLT